MSRPLSLRAAVPTQNVAPPLPRTLKEHLDQQGFETIPGKVPVRLKGADVERARGLQAMFEDAKQFLEGAFGGDRSLTIAFLTREQWEGLPNMPPYGIPFIDPEGVVAIPATADNVLTQHILSAEDRVSADTRQRILDAGFSYEEAARLFPELVSMHELGHRFFELKKRPWFNELMASYFGYAYLKEANPALATVWDALSDSLVETITPSTRSVAEFDRLYFGVGADTYLWFQGKFQEGVEWLYDAQGLAFGERVRAAFPKPSENLYSINIWDRVDAFAPGFRRWAQAISA
jgi:hypothetical protein